MFKAIWRTQTREGRWALALLVPGILAMPLFIASASPSGLSREYMTVARMESLGVAFGISNAVWALALGTLTAVSAWTPDRQGKHVYALSLPVSRRRYVFLRIGAAALQITIGVLVIGAVNAAAVVWLAPPPPLETYASAVTLRTWLVAVVTLVCCSAAWANDPLQKLPTRTQQWVEAAWVVGTVLAMIGIAAIDHPVAQAIRDVLMSDWSPLRLLIANWSLIDG